MAEAEKILIVEDEQGICHFLTALLQASGYGVLAASTGQEALTMTASHNPDLILLDLGLPDMDGMAVLGSIRKWCDTPLIVVSARRDEQEKVAALDGGANDYITKPFGNSELMARVRTALRVHTRGPQPLHRFCGGELEVDYGRRLVRVRDRAVHLTPIEYKILSLLGKNAGKVLTHDHIIHRVWGPFASDSQVLRVNMANIRRKIEPDPADPRYILTEVGVGYRMVDTD